MIYKYISEKQIRRFSGWWKTEDNTIVTNSEAERYAIASGEWKPLVVEDEPTYDPETQYLDYHYVDGEVIRQVRDIIDIPQDATEEDYIEALNELGVNTDEEG